ncbi:MAG: nucleotidyltransferase family protein [Muribaculaceae bacterium]|nr:nucleotidyltransferase family protein [Muribaculaceae bacterium]
MKAMVFAAGLGTRLKPFTDHHPKALAKVCGRPMLGVVIERLKKFGVDDMVVNVHHFADQIEDYLHESDDFGITIHVSAERSCLLDTGGGILAARQWLEGNEPFIVHNADILTDVNLNDLAMSFKDNDGMATLLVSERQTKRYLLFDIVMRMNGWTNIETGELRPETLMNTADLIRFAFGGVHIISPAVFPYLEKFASNFTRHGDSQSIPKFSIMDFYIASCQKLNIYGHKPTKPYKWHDIGKPDALIAAEQDFNCMNL